MSFPRYPEYKDSGVEWLGEVPGHWQVQRLANLFRQVAEDGRDDLPVLTVSIHSGVSDKEFDDNELDRKVTRIEDRTSYKRVAPGDLVYNMMRAWQGGFGTVTVAGLVSPAYVVARPIKRISTFLVEQQLRTPAAVEEMRRHSRGVTDFRLRLYWEEFKTLSVVVPPPIEEAAIAAFLDRETAKIDGLVAEQQNLIALLKEKRQALISHAVTKGLDPDVPMKDSGVAWLGEVPAHWEVTRIKRLCELITDGAHISPETKGGVFPFVSTTNISDEGIDFVDCLLTSPSSYEYLVKTGCKPEKGDVLFSKDGTIGRTAVVRESRSFVVASSLIIIRPNADELSCDYMNYLCGSDIVTRQVESLVKGAGLPRLSIQNLLKVVGIFPPKNEQIQIAKVLEQQTSSFDELIDEAERGIELLLERRTALISAAVTGKIDVRHLAVATADPTPEPA